MYHVFSFSLSLFFFLLVGLYIFFSFLLSSLGLHSFSYSWNLVCASVGRRVYWGVEISNRLYKRKHGLGCSVRFDTLVGRCGTVVIRCLITGLLIPLFHFSPFFFSPLFFYVSSPSPPFSCVLLLRHTEPLFVYPLSISVTIRLGTWQMRSPAMHDLPIRRQVGSHTYYRLNMRD